MVSLRYLTSLIIVLVPELLFQFLFGLSATKDLESTFNDDNFSGNFLLTPFSELTTSITFFYGDNNLSSESILSIIF